MQKAIFDGKVDTVVVWKLDRLSRSLKDGINTLTDWLEKGVRIIATTQQLDFNGAERTFEGEDAANEGLEDSCIDVEIEPLKYHKIQ